MVFQVIELRELKLLARLQLPRDDSDGDSDFVSERPPGLSAGLIAQPYKIVDYFGREHHRPRELVGSDTHQARIESLPDCTQGATLADNPRDVRHVEATPRALRGWEARILAKIPGEYAGDTSVTEYFFMEPAGVQGQWQTKETQAVKWVLPEEVSALLAMNNPKTRKRDTEAFTAAVTVSRELGTLPSELGASGQTQCSLRRARTAKNSLRAFASASEERGDKSCRLQSRSWSTDARVLRNACRIPGYNRRLRYFAAALLQRSELFAPCFWTHFVA